MFMNGDDGIYEQPFKVIIFILNQFSNFVLP
jgi:hypothetical protein